MLTYRQIADELAGHIAQGLYAPGARLPTYRELADAYGVSLSTLQRAVALLTDRRVVRGHQGRGLFVAET